jgi:flagellar biosynthesis protein FlhG
MAKKNLLKVITISSGKGGVGKTNVVANLAIALAKMGKKVMLLDANLGLGNLDVLLGLAPEYNFAHVLRGEKKIDEIIIKGPAGISIIPAASGLQELTTLSAEQKINLFSQLEGMDEKVDIMLIDTAAGISQNVLFFNIVASEIIIIASPEPTSIVDAYALIKVLHNKHGEKKFRLLVNQAKDNREGLDVYRNVSTVADKFLNISIDYMGYIPYDENVRKAVREQRAVIELFPTSKASKSFQEMGKIIDAFPPAHSHDNLQLFMKDTDIVNMERKPL